VPGQIERLFHLVLLRPPSADESKKFEAFIAKHGLPSACRVLLNCNEFHFVE
jgi:hypothetical protein